MAGQQAPVDDAETSISLHVNEVRVVGRLAAEPLRRELPSGDVLVAFRLVVERGPLGEGPGRRGPTVDTLDCAAWRKDTQRAIGRCLPGDIVEVQGSLRRRFWRSPAGAASRSEIETMKVRRIKRAE